MVQVFIPKLEQVDVKIDGNSVALVSSKGTVIRIPYQVVPTLCQAMNAQAKKIEEIANVRRLIGDQAFLLRAGVPIGLTDHPDIRKEAAHEAQYNDELRKQLPGGVKSKTMFGKPVIIKHPPKEAKNGELR